MKERVNELLEVVRLPEFADRRPNQLSGGQQQRIALARALVNLPKALLLDEPLGALDLKLRQVMQLELKRIQREVGITFIFVTHDQEEALTMSDRIAVMNKGRVDQIGTPTEIYHEPATAFVAGFIGTANLLPVTVRSRQGGVVTVDSRLGNQFRVPAGNDDAPAGLGGDADGAPGTSGARGSAAARRRGRRNPGVHRDLAGVPGARRALSGQDRDGQRTGRTPGPRGRPGADHGRLAHHDDVGVRRRLPGSRGPLRRRDRVRRHRRGHARGLLTPLGLTATDHDPTTTDLTTTDDRPHHNTPVPEHHRPSDGAPHMAKQVTRRQFMTRTGLAVGGLALGPQLLAACGDDDESSSGDGSSSSGEDIWFDNWTLYIDQPDGEIDGAGGTIDEFQKATGLSIKYTEGFNDNTEYFAKIQPLLSTGKPIGPNIIAPTFWLAGRLLTLEWLEKLPLDKIPNASNLVTNLQKPPSDPTGEYSLPWQAGIAGIAYNMDVTGREITTVEDLWDPAFKGKIGMLTEMRDTIGIIAMSLGIDLDKPAFQDFTPAFEKLDEEVQNGQIRQFTGNDYVDDLEQGNYAACIGWSGDVVQLAKSNPSIRFVVPESGGTQWFDTMVIPKGASNIDDVGEWMNFVYDPVNAARITAEVQYISPVEGVQDELRKMGGEAAELADSQLLFPDASTLAVLQSWGNLEENEEQLFDEEFARISGA